MKLHKTDFSKGKVSSCILRVALPMILAEFVNLLYSLVDRIYIGHISEVGPLALTGIGICFPIIALISAFAKVYGFNGGSPLCSMALGSGDEEEADKVLHTSFLLALYTALILMVLVLIFNRPILYAFGASDVTYPYARDYITIYVLGSAPVLLSLSLNAFINAQGFATIGMLTVIIGALTNIILDPILIYYFQMGVKGAATATVISQCLSCSFAIWFLSSKNATLRLNLKSFRIEKRLIGKIYALGASGFTMGATNSIVQIVCNRTALLWGGDLYVGVMTILHSVREIFSTPVNGIGSGASPVMSYNYGAKRGDRVIKASNFTLISCVIVSAVIWLLVILFPRLFASLFSHDEALISAAIPALRIYFFGFVFMAFQTTGQQTFVALGKAKPAIFFSLFRKVVIVVPLTMLFPYFFGVNGVMLAEPVSNVIGGLAAYLSMRHMVMGELRSLSPAEPDGRPAS